MDVLLPFVEAMPAPSGKSVGMIFQGYKACSGRPTGSHAAVLGVLANKIGGWSGSGTGSSKGKQSGTSEGKAVMVADNETQVTFRR